MINGQSLAKVHTGEEIDLSFAGYQHLVVVKANGALQRELLNSKSVYIVKAIPLTAIIFCNPNFLLCIRHTLHLAKKT